MTLRLLVWHYGASCRVQQITFCCQFGRNTSDFCVPRNARLSNNSVSVLKYLFTYLLTPYSRVLLKKLTSSQLVKKFPAFYGTQSFITTFTSARQLSLSWASWIQSIPPRPTCWKSILYDPPIYTRVSQVVSFLQVSPPKPCIRLSSPYVLHAPPISFSILSPEQYLLSSTDH